MNEVKIKQPKEIIIGETYMINYIGWKKVRALSLVDNNGEVLVQNFNEDGVPFKVSTDKMKINLIE